jgi:hypothetical protein
VARFWLIGLIAPLVAEAARERRLRKELGQFR